MTPDYWHLSEDEKHLIEQYRKCTDRPDVTVMYLFVPITKKLIHDLRNEPETLFDIATPNILDAAKAAIEARCREAQL